LGTFSYCMAALPAARSLPHPFVPVATVTGAMVLALLCVGWLIYFINHISQSISVNHIVDRIARETELVIDEFMPYPRGPFSVIEGNDSSAAKDGTPILNRRSGYIRYIDIDLLVALAKAYRICVHVERRVGQFVPAGVPLVRVSKPERVPADRAVHLIGAFDIGPTRTMQQDVEFGTSVSVISMIANTIDTTVMIEVAMLLRIICATPGSSREGKRIFGTHALIAGAASSSHDSTAPAVPRNRAIIKGRIRNPPRRAYIAERKSAGSCSNILECPGSGQKDFEARTRSDRNQSKPIQLAANMFRRR